MDIADNQHVRAHPGASLFSLALGGLSIGTTEFAAMGLLPIIATDLHVSIPAAGYIITAYALGVVVGAPLLTALAAKMNRRALLIGLMIAFTVANTLSAFAPNIVWLILARFVSGLPHGSYFGVGSVVGTAVVGKEKRGRAVATMMSGLTIANVIGVPFTTFVGQGLGWRSAFLVVGVLGLITLAALIRWVPSLASHPEATIKSELGALKNRNLLIAAASAAIGCGGMFAIYSYVAPLLTEEAGLHQSAVPIVLSLFGIGMTLGTLLGGRMTDRSVLRTVYIGFLTTIAVLVAIGLGGRFAVLAVAAFFALGFTSSILGMSMQTRLMDVSPKAASLGAALSHSALNVANALGAWLGGLVIAGGLGFLAPAWVGVVLCLAGLLIVATIGHRPAPHQAAKVSDA